MRIKIHGGDAESRRRRSATNARPRRARVIQIRTIPVMDKIGGVLEKRDGEDSLGGEERE